MEQEDGRKSCCMEDSNLVLTQCTDDLIVRVCQVCGCRHFELSVDTGKFLSIPTEPKQYRYY